MGAQSVQSSSRELWALVRRQHGAVSRAQLLAAGLSARAIKHRVRSGRLYPVHAGVYAVGRPGLTRVGELMAAVLACGDGALLSHRSAAELWNIGPRARSIEITVAPNRRARPPGIRVHRRSIPASDTTLYRVVPVTNPARTLVDIAHRLPAAQTERAVNEADKLDLIDPEALRNEIEAMSGCAGVTALRQILDRSTFTLTRSELERAFNPIARGAGLALPQTGVWVNGYEVDFYWPDLGLVVETDGLRYHRTAAQQTRALERDQSHYAADLTPLRFSHAQIVYRHEYVLTALTRARRRLERERGTGN